MSDNIIDRYINKYERERMQSESQEKRDRRESRLAAQKLYRERCRAARLQRKTNDWIRGGWRSIVT